MWGQERKEVMVQKVDVPEVVGLGEDVELECHYEISGNLYSIKWYLNDREFFRYQPHEETSIMIFERPGVNVNVSMTMLSGLMIPGLHVYEMVFEV